MDNEIKVEIIVGEKSKLPNYETPEASGMDLRAVFEKKEDVKQCNSDTMPIEVNEKKGILMIPSGARVLINSDLRIAIPIGYEAQLRSRSGLAVKKGLVVSQGTGTIDSDYRGKLGLCITNVGKSAQYIENGERVCQIVFQKVERISWKEVLDLSDTVRGDGGFGSTGQIENKTKDTIVENVVEAKTKDDFSVQTSPESPKSKRRNNSKK
tara:strand:+ start:47777 stop:48406 length:630 start_codon:yes stop_codon:yes gene_type:complete